MIEYTANEVMPDNQIKCPECGGDIKLNSIKTYKYIRNLDKEKAAIDECLKDMDFELLANACSVLSANINEYDYLGETTNPEALRSTAIDEIIHCFELMAEYGYNIIYQKSGNTVSYCTNGHFEVNTYYSLEDDLLWCDCCYCIMEGGLY